MTSPRIKRRIGEQSYARDLQDRRGSSHVLHTGGRVERARHLLESTDLPIDRVAEQADFGTAASLRQHLLAVAGVSPNAYRRTFHTTG